MATTLGKSTYQALIDDVRFDTNQGARLTSLPDRAIQKWILDAEQEICRRLTIRDSFRLGLNALVQEYPFRDRPLITAISADTPAVVTALAHGLITGDRILMDSARNNAFLYDEFRATRLTDDTFSVEAVLDVLDASNEDSIIIEAQNHRLTSGQTVTIEGVLGNTAANCTDEVITVVDANHFSIGESGNGTYSGGGTVRISVARVGTPSGYNRFWKDDELPTFLHQIEPIKRPWGNYIRPIVGVDISNMTEQEVIDSGVVSAVGDDYSSPAIFAEYLKFGARYLRFHPAPAEDKTVTIYGTIQVLPSLYLTDDLTATIHLPGEYDTMIRSYVEAKVQRWLGNAQERKEEEARFEMGVQTERLNIPSRKRKEIRYQ